MKASRFVIAGAAALAACGVLGMAPVAAQAGSAPDPAWTKQTPANSPPARGSAAMAYDAATGTVVLFGGLNSHGVLGDTWTWDGTTWTRQAPAAHPSARAGAAMAYDAATGTAVLFGGDTNDITATRVDSDTWTWDGTTWTRQHPAAHPSARELAAITYDTATGTVVLLGGSNSSGLPIGDTWTWDGTTWTQHATPATLTGSGETMAYDAATGNVVLFGGVQTWTWDGTTWTQATPFTNNPHARVVMVMAYDAATGTVVLFGGRTPGGRYFGDTWTWG